MPIGIVGLCPYHGYNIYNKRKEYRRIKKSVVQAPARMSIGIYIVNSPDSTETIVYIFYIVNLIFVTHCFNSLRQERFFRVPKPFALFLHCKNEKDIRFFR